MANEAVLKVKLDEPYDFIVDNNLPIEKGALLKISGNAIVATCDGSGDVWGGIARREKISGDGRTRLSVFRRGIFDMVATSGVGISAGEWVATSGVNLIRTATTAEVTAGKGIGIAREDIAIEATGEIILGGY